MARGGQFTIFTLQHKVAAQDITDAVKGKKIYFICEQLMGETEVKERL